MIVRPPRNFPLAIHSYCQATGCPDFTIAQIRTTAAVHLYKAVGGDLTQVKAFLQHKSVAPTSTYVLKRATESLHARSMQAAQSAMVARVFRPGTGQQ